MSYSIIIERIQDMSNQLRLAIPMVVAFFTASLFGDVWYVDAANYGKSGDGKNAGASAFGTIQEAVDAANANDTIMVAAGVYEQGETQDAFTNPMMNRVYISKPLTLCGADRHTTIIKGSKATDDPSLDATARSLGLGSDAIRCIGIKANNVVISNFTITGGATKVPAANDNPDGCGGGIYAANGFENIAVVDCIVSNNVANRAAAARYGNDSNHKMSFIRTWFSWNRAFNRDPLTRGCLLAHCLITKHPSQSALMYCGTLINCTFAGNRMRAAGENSAFKAYNCLFADSWYKQSSDGPYYANCAFSLPASDFTVSASTNEFCQFDVGYGHFVAPVFNNYRLNSNAACVIGKGDAEFLELIPEKYRNTDFYGEKFEGEGAVNIGCSQTAVEVTGGLVRFKNMPGGEATGTYGFAYSPSNMYFFGDDSVSFFFANNLAYAYATSARTILRVKAKMKEWKGLYGFKASGSDTVMRYPLMDGTYEIMIPPEGKTLELSPVEATSILYVDKNSKETEEDGSNAFPFKKIQSAVDSVASGTYGIVYVKEGIYDEESGKTAKEHFNRVSIAGSYVRLVSADGVGKATISGGSDPDVAKDEWPFGCGVNAMRCVYVGPNSAVQGFALTGGRCNISGTGGATHGGAAYLDIGAQLLDCILTDGIASQGSAVFGNDSSGKLPAAHVFRCLITGNYGIDADGEGISKSEQKGSGAVRRTTLASCIVSGNYGQGFGAWEAQYAYHSTLIGPGLGLESNTTFLTGPMTNINCLSVSPKDKSNAPVLYGGTWLCSSDPSAQSVGVVKKDALVADPAAGDFRISALSPARDAAVADFNGGGSDVNHSQYYIFGATDFYGNRFAVNEDGLPVCGAVSLFAPTLAFDEKEVAVSAPTVSEDGKFKVTCTAVSAATRPYLGMAVNGVTQETVSANCDFTVENAGNHPVPYEVEALYDTKWFVDEKSGNDSGWGTESSPKATLKGALQYALPGDSVFVAPGVYSNGVQYAGGELATGDAEYDFDLAARAVVTNDVKLIGAGAERTFIVGESAPNAQEEDFGCGEGAVRCIVLHPGSSLSGFTLTGGRTKASNSDDKGDALCGGGILASRCRWASPSTLYSKLPRIDDCVISNCVARRGAGAYNGVYNRCRFLDNRILSGGNGAAARGIVKSYLYCRNTVFDFNEGYSTTYYATLENCTIGEFNSQNGAYDSLSVINDSPLVANTLILGNKGCAAASGAVFSNCVFNVRTLEYLRKNTKVTISSDCLIAAADEYLVVDENYTPVIGANIAVDTGKAALISEGLGAFDLYGNPRKVNGARLDVGAVEADWKGEYSRVLGSRVCVTEASPEVLLDSTAPGVQIPAGAKLSLTYGRQGSTGARTEISASVGGTLTAETESWSRIFESGEGQTLSFKTDSDFTDFLFTAGDGTAVLHGISRRSPFAFVIR